jgi:hypothetical protein
MIVFDKFAQYSPEWWAVRRGVPTCSEFHRIITAAKAEFAAGHKSYINDLIGDELDGEYPRLNDGATAAMKRGTVLEPEARGLYEVWAGAPIRQVAFCTTDCGRFGSSPDSLVGADGEGVLEMKCPMPSTFAGYVIEDVLPAEYRAQCHGHLIVTGAKWCDFMSYLPGKEPFIKRVTPDDFTEKLRACLIRFDEAYRKARDRFKLANPMLPLSLLQTPAEPVTPAGTPGDRLIELAATAAALVIQRSP